MHPNSHQEVRILHVDDDPAFADLTGTFLEREDDRFAVETAASAEEGMERISDRPPDCVVSDFNMPGMDGIEFLRAVRSEFPDLPFILFTGKGSEAVASEAIAADATDYLQKGSGSEKYELLANRIRNAVQARREAMRAERQEQLMRLTEFAGNTGGFELDVDTGEVLLTDGACRVLNVPEQADPIHKDGLENFHPDDREKIQQTIQRALKTGEQTHGTWRYQHPDGEKKLLDMTYTPVTANGDTTIRGAVHDITDREGRERELRLLRQAIDNANVPIALADPSQEDNPLVYINDGFEEMTGYPPEETLGRNCRFLQGEDTDPEKVAALRNAIDNEETISVELRNYRKDGTEFWNRMTITPIYDDDGQLIRHLGTQEDVTDRKERERELTQTRDLMANMEQLADVGAWEYDSETDSLTLTDGVYRIHGLDPDADLSLEAAFQTFHPDDRGLLEDRFEACLETGEPYEMDVRLTTPDGEQKWITARGERVEERDGGVVRGYIRDITDLKKHEHERQRIIDRMNDAVITVDSEWRITLVNERTEHFSGLEESELLDQNFWDVFSDARGTRFEKKYRRAMEARDPVSVEDYYSELEEWFDIDVYPNSDGGLAFYFRSITEHKQREQELRETTTRLRAVLDTVEAAIFIKDTESRYQLMNQECRRLLGVDSREEITGQTDYDFLPEDTAAQYQRDDQRILENKETVKIEEQVPAPEGTQTNLTLKSPFYDENDELRGICAVSTDITQRKERERELERKTRRLEEFASILSHDLRNPLNIASGRLDLAQEECDSEHLEEIEQTHNRMRELIGDLLTLAREGEKVSEAEPVRFTELIEFCWENVNTREATLNIDANGMMRADRSRFKQLLENLIRNAVEHGGDEVTVSVGATDGGFYVADTGPGIPESDREEIFRVGYSTNEDGTGLGLGIVERIAEAHGWEITVTESEQSGARFEFTGVEKSG